MQLILIFSLINGILLPFNIKSSTVLSLAPILPEDEIFEIFFTKIFCFIVDIAIASPMASCIIVDDVELYYQVQLL